MLHEVSEGCGVADMIRLAVKLTDAGLGDYWDDVDSIVRNHGTEQQFIDLGPMRKFAGHGTKRRDDCPVPGWVRHG